MFRGRDHGKLFHVASGRTKDISNTTADSWSSFSITKYTCPERARKRYNWRKTRLDEMIDYHALLSNRRSLRSLQLHLYRTEPYLRAIIRYIIFPLLTHKTKFRGWAKIYASWLERRNELATCFSRVFLSRFEHRASSSKKSFLAQLLAE